jgi:3-hydroxyacyl-[acyl-carrier-protein] dehydratase
VTTPLAVLPEIVEQGPDFVVTSMEVAADDVIFDGHYPGSPIYPGVCLVECAHQSVSAALRQRGRTADLVAVHSARFHHPAFPGSTVSTRIAFTEADGELRCAAVLSEKDVELAAIRLRYRWRDR